MTPTQADREAAAQRMDKRYGVGHWLAQEFRDGKQDGSDLLASYTRHRLAAEAAAFEKAAGVASKRAEAYAAIGKPILLNAARQGEAERIASAILVLAGEKHD